MWLRKRENIKTTAEKQKREKRQKGENRAKGGGRERGENRERRNFGARNWRQSVGWLNRGVEGSESPCTPMEKKVQVRPHLTRLCSTAHPSSLLSLRIFSYLLRPFFFFFSLFSSLRASSSPRSFTFPSLPKSRRALSRAFPCTMVVYTTTARRSWVT